MQNETQHIQQNTIDFRELFAVFKRRKKMILGLTALLSILAVIYAFFIAKPVYKGDAMLEIGQVANEQFIDGKYSSLEIIDIDNINNLKILVSTITGVSAFIPKKTKLLTLSSQGYDKDVIKKKLKKTVTYILDRHEELSKFYTGKNSKVKMTQLVGDITVGDTAIKPKKKLIVIVVFIAGLMLSVFLAFFLDFIQGLRKLKIEKDK